MAKSSGFTQLRKETGFLAVFSCLKSLFWLKKTGESVTIALFVIIKVNLNHPQTVDISSTRRDRNDRLKYPVNRNSKLFSHDYSFPEDAA